MIITRPVKCEVDFLQDLINKPLVVKDFDANIVKTIEPPLNGWTHDKLESIGFYDYSPHYWDAYLGSVWIGSSEV
ncbi:MAG: hypothetical protein V7749_00745 [Cocleimonas sp.]